MLKGQNPNFFQRSIKFDDVNLSLVLDYTVEEDGPWHRVDYEEAASCARERYGSSRSSTSSAANDIRPGQQPPRE